MNNILHLPPLVVECPSCGERYLISRDPYIPSGKSTLFSDGYYTDEYSWRTPGIVGCITCELGFLPRDGKVIATPDWDDFYKNWSHLKQAQPPTAGALVLELRSKRNIEPFTEKAIRKELWYSALHTETGRALLTNNPKFKNFWLSSLVRLEELLDILENDERLIKAEVNRQLGQFEQCLDLIDTMQGKLADTIKAEAGKRNSLLVEV